MGTFKKDTIKANAQALSKYDELQKEALLTPVSRTMSPGNLIIHSAQSQVFEETCIDIGHDKKFIPNDTCFSQKHE